MGEEASSLYFINNLCPQAVLGTSLKSLGGKTKVDLLHLGTPLEVEMKPQHVAFLLRIMMNKSKSEISMQKRKYWPIGLMIC